MQIFADLARREREGRPIRIAVIGTGFFGGGVLRRIGAIRGLVPAVAANRARERAVAALLAAGVPRAAIRETDDPGAAQAALDAGGHVATADLALPAALAGIDVVLEATGDILVGTEVALAAIGARKHIVAANAEVQATVGPILKTLADEAGVVYSDVDGDEPAILADLFAYCVGLGLDPLLAGNCKGVLKRHATPATQAAFARDHGLRPWLATAAADGTKLNLEMAVVANATGMIPATPGMTGLQTTADTLLADLARHGLLDRGPLVEYTLGMRNGVFMVIRSDDPAVRRDFRYLKLGDGPHYVLTRPHVMIHYEAPLTSARAALHGTPAVAPRGAPVAEVAAFAKRPLRVGARLDGIGGFDAYGLIVTAAADPAAGPLPVCLAGYARLTRDIPQDAPIPLDAVEFAEDNAVLALRRRQDALFAARPAAPR